MGSMIQDVCACVIMSMCVWVSVGAQSDTIQVQRTKYSAAGAVARNRLLQCTRAQSNIEFKELMGLWNVIEVIEHSERYNDRRNYLRPTGQTRSDSCPVVHFSADEGREVRMLWNDEIGYIQYNFRMTNVNNPGFWLSLGYQSGTMVDNDYQHFTGTVQVMKAVQSHMVLTFCSPHERHFSIILARNKYLSHEEVRGVHKQLNRVNLPLVAVQSYCRNAGVSAKPGYAPLALLLALALCYRRMS